MFCVGRLEFRFLNQPNKNDVSTSLFCTYSNQETTLKVKAGVKLIPDDGLFAGIIQGHEQLGVFSDAADEVPDKDVEAVCGGRLDAC